MTTDKVVRTRLLRRKDASQYLKDEHDIVRTPKYLAKLSCIGGGPPMQYDGRRPLYPTDGLDDWAQAQISPRVRSTSERRVQRENRQQQAAA